MNNGATEYRRMGVASRLESATPHELVLMLFDGAMTHLKQARGCITHRDIEGRARALGKALAIIDGLQGSLDLEHGGELAGNLDALYDYMHRRLFRANTDNDTAPIDEVLDLLDTVRQGWRALELDRVS